MTTDYIFVFFAVWLAMIADKTNYRVIALILVADFCVFVGIDELWLASTLPGGDWIMPYKAMIYIAFAATYAIARSNYLSVLSVVIAGYHAVYPILANSNGLWLFSDYTQVMTIYCLLQLIGAFIGILYGNFYRHHADRSWRGHSRHSV